MADKVIDVPPHVQEAANEANKKYGDTDVGRATIQGSFGVDILTDKEEKSELSLKNLTLGEEKKVLQEQNIRDALTGLFNRRRMDEVLKELRPDEEVSILMIDIDGFKKFNDTYGHKLGDKMLISIARTLQNKVKVVGEGETDEVFRYGGEEILILMKGLKDPGVLRRRAEEIRQAVKSSYIDHNGEHLSPTISVGAAARLSGENINFTVGRADSALLEAKDGGKDKVVTNPANI